jgi:hypothetical protein
MYGNQSKDDMDEHPLTKMLNQSQSIDSQYSNLVSKGKFQISNKCATNDFH